MDWHNISVILTNNNLKLEEENKHLKEIQYKAIKELQELYTKSFYEDYIPTIEDLIIIMDILEVKHE